MKKEKLFKAETFNYICRLIKEKLTKTIKGNIQVWVTEVKAENFETTACNFDGELHVKFSIDLGKDICSAIYIDAIWYYNIFDVKEFAAIVTDNINNVFNDKKTIKKMDMMVQDENGEIFSVYRKAIMDK